MCLNHFLVFLTFFRSTACLLPMLESSAAIATPAMAAKASRAVLVLAIVVDWVILVPRQINLSFADLDLLLLYRCPDSVDTSWSLAGEVGQREKYGRRRRWSRRRRRRRGGGGREGASAPVLTVCMHLGWSHTQGWILFWSPFQTVQQEGVEWREIVKYSSQIWTEQLPHWGALTLVDWVKVHILMWCRCTKALTRSIVHEYDQPVWKISGSVVQKVNRNPLWILLKLCVWLLELGRVEIAQYDYECSGVPHRRRFQKFQGVRLEGGYSTM